MGPLIERLLGAGAMPVFVCLTARIGGLFMVAPLWSLSTLPRMVRTALVVMLAVTLLPSAPPVVLPSDPVGMPLTLATEFAIGIVIGLGAAALVQAMALAGEVVATQMGLQMAPLFAPLPELQVSGIGQLQTLLAIAIYTRLDGHLLLLEGLAASLRVLPAGTLLHPAGMTGSLTSVGAMLFGAAIRAAAPVMATLLLTQLVLAVMSRAIPQLNAMTVSLPFAVAAGLVMVGLTLPLVGGVLEHGVRELPGHVDRVVHALAGPVPGH